MHAAANTAERDPPPLIARPTKYPSSSRMGGFAGFATGTISGCVAVVLVQMSTPSEACVWFAMRLSSGRLSGLSCLFAYVQPHNSIAHNTIALLLRNMGGDCTG